MDKYQKYLIQNDEVAIRVVSGGEDRKIQQRLCLEDGVFEFTQMEDITISKYSLLVLVCGRHGRSPVIADIKAFANGSLHSLKNAQLQDLPEHIARFWKSSASHGIWKICDIDMEDSGSIPEYIEFQFKYDLCEPLAIKVQCQFADKDAYYAKKAAEVRSELLKAMDPKHQTGSDNINFYWNLANASVATTKVELYAIIDKLPRAVSEKQFSNETRFWSISGLAYGDYAYKITQYDQNGNQIVESDMVETEIKRQRVYPGKNLVVCK